MKRILILAVLTAASCNTKKDDKKNPEKQVTTETTAKDTVCIDLSGYDAETTNSGRAAWLRNYGSDVCPDLLYTTAESAHVLLTAPASISSATITKTWDEIQLMMGTNVYGKYIEVVKNPSNHAILQVGTTTQYNENNFCFSIPLFKGIDKKYSLVSGDKFEFYSTKIGVKYLVVFKLIRAANPTTAIAYYDYSDRPVKSNTTTDTKSPL